MTDGITLKRVATWVTFGWTHIPPTWIPSYAVILGVIAVYGIPMLMETDKAFNRVFLVGLMLVVSQHLIPTAWSTFKTTMDFQFAVALLFFYALDYALAAGGWSSLDKHT